MRRLTYILTIFIGIICSTNLTGGESNLYSRLFSEQDILEKLKYQKATIDTLFNHSKDKLLIFVKLADKDELEQITNGKFPENVETTFNILKDSFGKVITVSEFPFSESGDWYIVLTHYFDKDGKTFAFERQTNFFNSICTDGVAHETKTEFYNSDFQIIDKEYKIVDKQNKPLRKDSCQFPYNIDYKVKADIDKYFKTNKIKNVL